MEKHLNNMENKYHIVPMDEANFDDYEIQFYDVKITYSQNDDENRDNSQEIVISTRDNGGGRFYNISTESWSFDTLAEFANILKDFAIRAGMDLNDLIVNLENKKNEDK